MTRPLSSFSSCGAWTVLHPFHYEAAYFYRAEFLKVVAQLASEEDRLRATLPPDEHRELRIHHETDALRDSCFRAGCAAVLFACMSFEAFLNYFGVRKLGEDYHKRFVERLGVTEKVAYLVSVSSASLLSCDSQLIVRCRRLFEARNALVHPKSREIHPDRWSDFVSEHPSTMLVQSYFDDLEFCIDAFCEVDTEIDRDYLFPKHNS